MNDYVHYEAYQGITSPKEALVDGLKRAHIRLAPHRVWFYCKLLQLSFSMHYIYEHLVKLIAVLILAYGEMHNLPFDLIPKEKIEEIKAIYGVQRFPFRETPFKWLAWFTKYVLLLECWPQVITSKRSYQCLFNGKPITVPLEWEFNSLELRSYLEVKPWQNIKAVNKKGKIAAEPVQDGFYILRVEGPPSERFVDEYGFLWIEMIDFQTNNETALKSLMQIMMLRVQKSQSERRRQAAQDKAGAIFMLTMLLNIPILLFQLVYRKMQPVVIVFVGTVAHASLFHILAVDLLIGALCYILIKMRSQIAN